MRNDDTFGGLREGEEMYGFRLNGHNSKGLCANGELMADYIEENYKHIFNDEFGGSKIMSFRLFRIEATSTVDTMPTSSDPKFYGSVGPNGRNIPRYYYDNDTRSRTVRHHKWREKRKGQIENETPDRKLERLNYQKEYARKKRLKAKDKKEK
jgi:hypothetical protein